MSSRIREVEMSTNLNLGVAYKRGQAPTFKLCTQQNLRQPTFACVSSCLVSHYSAIGGFISCDAPFTQGAPKGRQQKGETGPGTHIFADFCRFSLIFGSLCKSRDLGVADLRRKPQETTDFRRKPQKTADFCRNRFLPFAVSLLARSNLPPAKNYLRKKHLEELFSGPLRQFCVINYAKEFSEKYFLRSYANFA